VDEVKIFCSTKRIASLWIYGTLVGIGRLT